MSVYKRDYRAYSGRLTAPWQRIAVLVRYGMAEVWSSKIAIGLFLVSLLPFVVFLIQIYFANNPTARLLVFKGHVRLLDIDAQFFVRMLQGQCFLALAVAAWIAPRLISFDLSDNALPILLSHPVSRAGYLLGKFSALFVTLSAVTWLPCLVLFAYQGYSSEQPWVVANLQIAAGMFVGAAIWIVLLSFIGLALSAWVKWRVVATGAIFAAVLVPAGVGGIVSAVMRTKWGYLLNLPEMMIQLWRRLLGAEDLSWPDRGIPTVAILIMLTIACLACMAMLNARIRAREVVKG